MLIQFPLLLIIYIKHLTSGVGNPQHGCQSIACKGILCGTHALGWTVEKGTGLYCHSKNRAPFVAPPPSAWHANILQVEVVSALAHCSKTLPTPALHDQFIYATGLPSPQKSKLLWNGDIDMRKITLNGKICEL